RMGGRMIDELNILPEPLSRSFSGAIPASSAFFFMNLFLHVAFPLCLVFILWLHTSKLTNSKWILNQRMLLLVTLGLTLLSIFWPAPLAQAPDALILNPSYPVDLFYTACIPLLNLWSVPMQWIFWISLTLITVSMPW